MQLLSYPSSIILALDSCVAQLGFALFNQLNFQYIFKEAKREEEVLTYSMNHAKMKKFFMHYSSE